MGKDEIYSFRACVFIILVHSNASSKPNFAFNYYHSDHSLTHRSLLIIIIDVPISKTSYTTWAGWVLRTST